MTTLYSIIVLVSWILSIHGWIVPTPRKACVTRSLEISMKEGDRKPAQNDFISRLVSAFLPTPEDVGLTRYDTNTRPENYPATKTEFAPLLPEDKADKNIALIRQTLAKTNLANRKLKLVYNANKDGWRKDVFHSKVDKLGPAIVLARSVSGGVFGGYNPTGWVNYGEYRGSIAAFLFYFPQGDDTKRPIKLQKIGGAGLAQVDDGGGPRFGSEGLTIPLSKESPQKCRVKLGLYYERTPEGKNTFLPSGKMEDELSELFVYTGIYEQGEPIPYSDALPFSLN